MTTRTMYVPRLIESAEQAEALPRGTVATYGEKSAKLTAHHVGNVVTPADAWLVMDELMPSAEMIGWTALVPIEAEEETTRAEPFADGTIHVSPQYWRDEPSRRLVTPWEEAQ
ncbi:hypothetical protein ACIGH6_14295 [Brachybacterium paraconglomeratum]|uniref:hypothetical protein n=1 Tax=Brachybacterium paraconglomeratum TaxID=173362 RepID=UPI0037C52DEF